MRNSAHCLGSWPPLWIYGYLSIGKLVALCPHQSRDDKPRERTREFTAAVAIDIVRYDTAPPKES